VVAIAANSDTAYAIRSDGTVWRWGTAEDIYEPSLMSLGAALSSPAVAITTSYSRVFVLRADGGVLTWSPEVNFGQPETVGLPAVKAVSGPYLQRVDGVWKWNDMGFPNRLTSLDGFDSISTREGAGAGFALRNGTVWSWGDNSYGARGFQCDAQHPACAVGVTQIPGLSGVTSVAGLSLGGYALLADGSVWGWGLNDRSQLASSGAGYNSAVPLRLAAVPSAVAIAGAGGTGWAVTP
jgi:hypothetical protein